MRLTAAIIISVALLASFACSRTSMPGKSHDRSDRYNIPQYEYYYVEGVKQKLLGNAGEALKYFEQCLRINPESDAANYQIAQIVAATGDLKNARKYAVKAYKLSQDNLWYLMMLSQLYYQDKNIDSAIVWYEKAVHSFPDNENIQLALGNMYIENRQYEKANRIFDNFDRKYGMNETSTISSVRSLMESGKYADARKKLEALVSQEPDNILYNGLLAEAARKTSDTKRALEIYSKLVSDHPENPQVQMSFAEFLAEEKMYDDFFSLLNSITLNDNIDRKDKFSFFAGLLENRNVASVNDNRMTISLLILEAKYKDDIMFSMLRPELMLKQGRLDEAAARYEQIVSEQPANYLASEKLLFIYLETGNYEKLLKRGEEFSTKFNMSFTAKALYAQAAIETGKYDIAIAELNKAAIIAGNNADLLVQTLSMKADAYYRMKDFDMAFNAFEDALKYNKEDVTVLNNYAYYLAEQDMRLKEAEEMARMVVSIEKNNNTYLDTYGWVLFKRGKLNDAAKVFEAIIKSGDKPDAEWFEHYGFVLMKQKKCDKARESWKKALELDPLKVHLKEEIENCGK